MKTVLAAVGIILFLSPGLGLGAELVVDQRSPAASDDNPGTAEKPFKTIGAAVAKVGPGDTVLVKGGVYREAVEIKTAGTPEKRITLKGAPGERALVNGAAELKGWKRCTRDELRGNPNWENIWWTEIGFATSAIFVDETRQTPARWPKGPRNMYIAESGDKLLLADSRQLTQPAGFWEGGRLTVYHTGSTNRDPGLIARYDPQKHELTVAAERREAVAAGKDLYYVENVVSIITLPGEYVIDESVQPNRIYLWPSTGGDPNSRAVEAAQLAREGALVSWSADAAYLTIDGLEAAYGQGSGIGSWAKGAHDVDIQNCIAHHNIGTKGPARGGYSFYGQSKITVRHSISWANVSLGVYLEQSKDCLIEENEIYANYVDGTDVGWHSDNLRYLRNYVHDQWEAGHPDGFQTYYGVDNLLVEGNLFVNVGQGWQCNNTWHARILNNVWVGTHHTGWSWSNRSEKVGSDDYPPCSGFEVRHNTVACVGFVMLNVIRESQLTDNVFFHGRPNGGLLEGDFTWQSDRNLLWAAQGGPGQWKWQNKFLPSFQGYQQTSGQDAHSKFAYPKFRNGPVAYVGANGKYAPMFDMLKNANTREKLYPDANVRAMFEVGDCVEVNFDGVRRMVKELGDAYVVIDPPLARAPNDFVLANWKKAESLALDLRLADDSPGKGLAEGGKDPGSSIDIQAYMKGDFNGDGRRDLPALPKELVGK